jgi:hypothetical protein
MGQQVAKLLDSYMMMILHFVKKKKKKEMGIWYLLHGYEIETVVNTSICYESQEALYFQSTTI